MASTFGRKVLQAGDEIVLSQLEHHSNIVPWQLLRDDRLGVPAKARASFGLCNTFEDVDALVEGLQVDCSCFVDA